MKKFIATLAAFSPTLVLAQSGQQITDVNSLTVKLTNLGNTFIQLLIAFAVIWIIYNVILFLVHGDSEEKRKTARGNILWGIVGLFVIMSIWGLVRILTNTFRTDNDFRPRSSEIPIIPSPLNVP